MRIEAEIGITLSPAMECQGLLGAPGPGRRKQESSQSLWGRHGPASLSGASGPQNPVTKTLLF